MNIEAAQKSHYYKYVDITTGYLNIIKIVYCQHKPLEQASKGICTNHVKITSNYVEISSRYMFLMLLGACLQ